MKSFNQFWEDASTEDEEKVRMEKRKKSTKEANKRNRNAEQYTNIQKQRTLERSADAEQQSQEVEQKTKELALRRIEQRQESEKKAAETAKATKKVAKNIVNVVKKIVRSK